MPAREPFVFREQHFLFRPLGQRAQDLPGLLRLIEQAPDGAIFCHVHLSRLRPEVQRSGLLNNFASWVLHVLHERILAERLAMVDGATSASIAEIRDTLVRLVSAHGGQMEHGPHALPGREFHLLTVEGDVVQTGATAGSVAELVGGIRDASRESLIYHVYTGPLRGQEHDDFSVWLDAIGRGDLAAQVRAVPVWTLPVEALGERLTQTLENA